MIQVPERSKSQSRMAGLRLWRLEIQAALRVYVRWMKPVPDCCKELAVAVAGVSAPKRFKEAWATAMLGLALTI